MGGRKLCQIRDGRLSCLCARPGITSCRLQLRINISPSFWTIDVIPVRCGALWNRSRGMCRQLSGKRSNGVMMQRWRCT